ncbi:hypothetical protein PIB30_039076 [Stylosanthes scabra]|uniref:Uncharacterized protein n=1 Tax=Stylosanthes scabra TaxID=79078 RepID=A0ABU6VE76_9FABA|nr:hypothetical protein [Stylosanthes scabra]
MTLESGRTPTQSEVFAGTHTQKEDQLWVDKRSEDVNDAFIAELKRLQEERQAIIDAGDLEDDHTASGPLDLREQVILLNREISQQAEVHAQSLAVVEAVCAEMVRTLESTVQMQSQEVSELRKAYFDMYSFLTQMRSSGSSSAAMPDMPPPLPPPPPPPPPARSQSPLPATAV